ncbi:MAG TPA: hypothetical protein VF188_07965, partial [Longimicrobiales bacterium]
MIKRTKRLPLAGALLPLLALLAIGCADEPTAPTAPVEAPTEPPAPTLGLVEVTLTGIGTPNPGTYALSAASLAELDALRAARARAGGGLSPQSLTLPDSAGGGADGTIQLEPISTGSFTEGTRGSGGVRYVWASYRVRNAQADSTAYNTPRENLTFLAVAMPGTIGTTPISALERFGGGSAAASIAQEMVPTGQVHRGTDGEIVSTGPDVLQVLTEAEAGTFTPPGGVFEVFPYGFVVRNPSTPNSRALPASPAADQYDGVITFAFKIPLQATPAEDPFTVSVMFLPVDDSETWMTQSPEEQDAAGQAAFEARAAALGATQVTLLSGGAYGGTIPQRTLCGARAAGPLDAPTAVVGGSCSGARGIIFVDAGAAAGGDGTSWAKAYTDLQNALAVAGAGDEVWVAAGTYTPGTARNATFQLASGVAVYGGFTGTETDRGARNSDPATNGTILSGDVNGDDTSGGSNAENVYHVVTASGTDATAVLDGFTITAGNANLNNANDSNGGGMYNGGGSPTLANLRFLGNTANRYGGGMYNSGGSPALSDVAFEDNTAGYGGGMGSESSSTPALDDVTFTSNTATNFGGGLYNEASNPVLTGVTFTTNSALHGGGMADVNGSVSTLRNVTFTGNTATSSGGGLANEAGGESVLVDVHFFSNTAAFGGGLMALASSPKIANAVFSGNTATSGGGGASVGGTGSPEPVFVNVLFTGNTVTGTSGGGGLEIESGNVELVNVTFSRNNSAAPGGGIANYANVTLVNTILWGNTADPGFAEQIWNTGGGTATVSFSIVEDCVSGGALNSSCGADGGNNRADD